MTLYAKATLETRLDASRPSSIAAFAVDCAWSYPASVSSQLVGEYSEIELKSCSQVNGRNRCWWTGEGVVRNYLEGIRHMLLVATWK